MSKFKQKALFNMVLFKRLEIITKDYKMKKLLLCALLLSQSAFTKTLEEIQNDGLIRIGVFGKTEYLGYVDANDKNSGFDVEVARHIAMAIFEKSGKTEGLKIEFKVLKPSERIGALKTDEVDMVVANFSVNPQRKKEIDFSLPYMKSSLGLVSHKDNLITDIKQLDPKKGHLVGVVKGSVASEFIRKKYSKVQHRAYEAGTEVWEALKKGEVQAYIQDNMGVLIHLSKPNSEFSDFSLSISAFPNTEENIAIGVKKGNRALLQFINGELKKMKKNGKLLEIYENTLRIPFGDKIEPKQLLILN